jgi:hypothetical protein
VARIETLLEISVASDPRYHLLKLEGRIPTTRGPELVEGDSNRYASTNNEHSIRFEINTRENACEGILVCLSKRSWSRRRMDKSRCTPGDGDGPRTCVGGISGWLPRFKGILGGITRGQDS